MGELGLIFLGEGRALATSEVEGVSKVDGRYFGRIVILVGVRICSIYGKTGEGVK